MHVRLALLASLCLALIGASAAVAKAAPAPAPAPTSAPAPAAPSASSEPAAAPPSTPPTAAPAPTAPPTPAATSAKPGAGADEEPKEVSEETKAEARRHFQRGLELLREQAWAPSLAEFLLSRQLYPTRVATKNAAFALRKLERYDEALAMYETLLRDFEVAEAEKQSALQQLTELRGLVGTIDISGAEPGSTVVVSSQDRGAYPPVEPIRVAAGTHVVRIFKEGFEPFETRIDVAGGDLVHIKAKMAKLKDSGRLRIAEKTGRAVDVVVDNVTVGKAPWEGVVGVGPHMVMLRGEGKLGTQPTSAPVKSGEVTTLTLLATSLEASLRIDPTPPGASVFVNGVDVGRGVWLGRLEAGPHKIEVKAEGFLTATRDVVLQKGQREKLAVSLDRDEEAPMWRIPPKWTLDFGASMLLIPTFGGDVAGGCDDTCQRNVGLGALALLHGTYELGSGLGFGLELGYLIGVQSVKDRPAQLHPHGLTEPVLGTATDDLRLQGFMGGATIGYHLGDELPVQLQLGAGVVVGEFRDERAGRFESAHGGTVDTFPISDFSTATYFYVDPEIRAGFRIIEHLELTASVRALMLIGISKPTWDDTLELAAGSDGIATYDAEQLMGDFVLTIAPGLNLRYDF